MELDEYDIHPLCAIFPWIEGERYGALKEDIQKYGQRDTIKLYRGQILDGKNRLKICLELNISPRMEDLPDDTNIIAYIKSVGLHRRDLNAAQRIEIAIAIETYDQEQKGTLEQREKMKEDPKQALFLEEAEDKRIAKEADTKIDVVKKYRDIKKAAVKNQKALRIKNKVLAGDMFIKNGHAKLSRAIAVKERGEVPKPAPKPTILEENETLRETVRQQKMEIAQLKEYIKKMVQEFKNTGTWDAVRNDIFPIMEGKKEVHTIAEMREAGLI